MKIRSVKCNRSEDSLLHSESDEDHPIACICINVIDSDDGFICEMSSNEETSRPSSIGNQYPRRIIVVYIFRKKIALKISKNPSVL